MSRVWPKVKGDREAWSKRPLAEEPIVRLILDGTVVHQIRALTRRKIPLRMGELIETINPIIRGWGNYYCRSHVRKRFHQLDGWIIRRLWSHRAERWRNALWKEYPVKRLRSEFKLVSLVSLIPSLQTAQGLS